MEHCLQVSLVFCSSACLTRFLYACCQTEVSSVWLYLQGLLVHNMRYLASVVSNCFTAFGELLALHKRFAELSGGVERYLSVPLVLSLALC